MITNDAVGKFFAKKYGPPKKVVPDLLKSYAPEVGLAEAKAAAVALAIEKTGSAREAIRWLRLPLQFELPGREPGELLSTVEGCNQLQEILHRLFPSS